MIQRSISQNNRKVIFAVLSILASFALVLTAAVPASAAELTPRVIDQSQHSVTFGNLDRLGPNEKIETVTKNEKGEKVTIGIQDVSGQLPNNNRLLRSATRRWKIWYYAGTTNASFYMNVTNNQVTATDSWWIFLVGSTYANVKLYHTRSYGELDFDETSYLGILSARFWLRGTATGRNNDVRVSY